MRSHVILVLFGFLHLFLLRTGVRLAPLFMLLLCFLFLVSLSFVLCFIFPSLEFSVVGRRSVNLYFLFLDMKMEIS